MRMSSFFFLLWITGSLEWYICSGISNGFGNISPILLTLFSYFLITNLKQSLHQEVWETCWAAGEITRFQVSPLPILQANVQAIENQLDKLDSPTRGKWETAVHSVSQTYGSLLLHLTVPYNLSASRIIRWTIQCTRARQEAEWLRTIHLVVCTHVVLQVPAI